MKLGSMWAGAVLAMLPAVTAAQVVSTESGKVAGSTSDGVSSWKGIPFAAPPVGPLRWRAPQPAARWDGVRQATAYGHDCMQVPFPSDAAPLGTTPGEDCLTLNVWRPAAATRPLPVIVWIYGGGFVNGGASPPTYSGANLAQQGVMFVSFNYRLGRFGTFAHPQLTAQDPDGGRLGNYGYMDQIAALRWVQRNIAAFGGDPKNVTLVGESAGGMSVNTMVTSPLTTGLFARAIVMSGGNGHNMGSGGLAGAEKIGVDFAASKGIARDDPAALEKLRALSADAVTDGLNLTALFAPKPGPRTFASPFVDGTIAVDAATAYRDGAFPTIPIMIGATDNDIGGPTGYMVGGARQLAGWISKAGAPAYHYRFAYVAQSLNKKGADHATDIPWFFDTAAIKYGDAITPRDRAMARTISAYVVNFAKTGNPNGRGLASWPRYDARADTLLEFTPDGRAIARKDPLGPAIDAAPAPTR
ncbi:carboxylesterase/lipase family protein [Sphingomonas sp.]|jgi:para-nitrobenzyl esterase|uniref:carboxylesterase/lipase family protein n=1 Tax=Sphingomonas sp. TaxID=28214 RepID=UPI0035C826AC